MTRLARGGARAHRAPIVVALAVALTVAWLAPLAGITTPAGARAADTDLTLVTDAVYTVEPEHGRAHVSMSVVARNHRRETRTRRYYFTHAYLAVQPGARDIRVSGAKGVRVRVAKRTDAATLLRIDLGERLYGGKSKAFRLSYNLVDAGGAADRELRLGRSLVTLPVWAFASDGAQGSRVRVRIPAGFEVAVERGRFDHRSTADDGTTELATDRLRSPLSFFAFVTARRPPAYVETPLGIDVGDTSVPLVLRAWDDDPAWAERAGSLLTQALPLLREQVGIPWPATQPTVIEEVDSHADGGYAGLYEPDEHRIEVAWWADPAIVLHEAAHGWFNGGLVADRWVAEGFASLYANRAAKGLGVEVAAPVLTDELRDEAVPLNAWSAEGGTEGDPGVTTEGTPDGQAPAGAEAYGFAASLALAEAIAERAGDDALRNVWAAAAGGIAAHQPPDATGGDATGAAVTEPAPSTVTDPELVTGTSDWRGLLDLLEAETGRDFTDLWRQWVVRPGEADLLDARAAAIASYRRTLALADGWSLPAPIREALRAWQFASAEQLLADARTVLAQRQAVEEMADREGIVLPDTMQRQFETGAMVEASATAEAQRSAMLVIGHAAEQRGADPDPLSRLGMVGENPEAALAAARTALAEGDMDRTLAAADDAFRAWSGAWQEGRRRALLVVAVLATIVVLLTMMIGRARRRRPSVLRTATIAPAAVAAAVGPPAVAAAVAPAPAGEPPAPADDPAAQIGPEGA
jgi:hypothetical protein